jgi:hypothetical protein
VLFTLLFNSIGALYAASSLLSRAQTFANDNTALICTGSSFKWISMSVYQQTGIIAFVDAPDNAPSNIEQTKCSYAYLADTHCDDKYLTGQKHTISLVNSNIAMSYINAIYATAKHQLAPSRGPPIFS